MSKSILIIRPGAIGDTLLIFPILRALKAQKQAHITLVSNPTVTPLAQAFGLADAVFDYAALAWSDLFSSSGIRSPLLLDILQKTDSVICWLRDPDGMVERNLRAAGMIDVLVAPGRPDETSNVHIVEYLAGTLGMLSTNDDAMQIVKRIDDENIQTSSILPRTIAVHPGSGGTAKCWPIAHFASVITTLWQQDIPVLLLAGPADTERLATLLKLLGTPLVPSLLTMMENIPLLQVAVHLKRCSAYLGNDSGITHLAAMLGIPTTALFGPSNPGVWRPVGPYVRVLYNPDLGDIAVGDVLDAINSSWGYDKFSLPT